MNNNSNKILGIAIHTGVWMAFLSMPYVLAFFTGSHAPPFDFGALEMPLQVIVVFYINYFLLINIYLFRKRIWHFLLTNLIMITGITLMMGYLRSFWGPPPMHHHPMENEPAAHILKELFFILIQCFFVGLSVAVKVTGKWYEEQQRVKELEKAHTEAELQELKSQLNPHFLFNSLNNIYALIDLDKEKAKVSVISLCEMLRYQLYEANREVIPLEKEIEFVHNYCDLMLLRIPRHVVFDLDLEQNCSDKTIAPLLFVTLVENAFKHGISQNKPSHISVRIACEGNEIVCLVRNTNFPKNDNDRSGSGIGLENLMRRLELLYPGKYAFDARIIGDEYVSLLTIRS